MTYGIITHYDVLNHGAVLQLRALQRVLERDFGITAQALRYDKNYDFMGRALKAKYEPSLRSAGIYLKFLRQRGARSFLFEWRKQRLFARYKRERRLVGAYYSECPPLAGCVVGSDEVFALHTGPTPALFGHALPSGKVFAYAGSFGPTTLADIDRLGCRGLVRGGLEGMQGIGLRDRNSLDIATTLVGHTDRIRRVCDPVLLYGYRDEIAQFTPEIGAPYLLIYAYNQRMNAPHEVAFIRSYARRHGLQVVSAGFYHAWADRSVCCDPEEVLRYFKGAQCVVTDTFHGTVMSLITQRPFASVARDNGNKLLCLLEEYGLGDRLVDERWLLADLFSRPVDWTAVEGELARRRSESLAYLGEMIGSDAAKQNA